MPPKRKSEDGAPNEGVQGLAKARKRTVYDTNDCIQEGVAAHVAKTDHNIEPTVQQRHHDQCAEEALSQASLQAQLAQMGQSIKQLQDILNIHKNHQTAHSSAIPQQEAEASNKAHTTHTNTACHKTPTSTLDTTQQGVSQAPNATITGPLFTNAHDTEQQQHLGPGLIHILPCHTPMGPHNFVTHWQPPLGHSVSNSIKHDIWALRYVDFTQLIGLGWHHTPDPSLSKWQWLQAWNIYNNILLARHPHLATSSNNIPQPHTFTHGPRERLANV
jgi:hypothetical protein